MRAILLAGGMALVFTLLGTIRSTNGEEYRYPLTLRLIS